MAGALAALAAAVLTFSDGWRHGGLVLDGPGVALYSKLALDHFRHDGVLPYWLHEMWAGSPAWALAPSFPIIFIFPLVAMLGADGGVKLAALLAQIVGAWGAFVLARAMWDRFGPALLAGLVYGLHPILISHAALAGHETDLWVMAATPWLAWSVIKGLRGDGPRYVALAGLLAAFAILQQAEHTYSLVLLCGCLMVTELSRAKRAGSGPTGRPGVWFRAGVVAAICLGVLAHWLLPFLALGKSFVFTPAVDVKATLIGGVGGFLGHEPGAFLTRSPGITGTIGYADDKLFSSGTFYLGWVCLALTLVTIVLLAFRDRDRSLAAILLASAVGVWLSSGGVSLASSELVQRRQFAGLAVIGALAGALMGSFLRHLKLGRVAVFLGSLVTVVFLVALPYLTPFVALQRVVPFLGSIRFPRFYPLAALGLALGAAYPVTVAYDWVRDRLDVGVISDRFGSVGGADLASLLSAALCLAVGGAFLVDVSPYRSFYQVHPPHDGGAYQRMAARLASIDRGVRIAVPDFGDPRLVSAVVDSGHEVVEGWPHPIAAKGVWRLAVEALSGPRGYSDGALGLAGGGYRATEMVSPKRKSPRDITDVTMESNPQVKPVVRAYERVAVTASDAVAAELAVNLSRRNIGVVHASESQMGALGGSDGLVAATLGSDDPCRRNVTGSNQAAAGDLATACALDDWVSVEAHHEDFSLGAGAGAVFRATQDGLRGVSVLLTGPAGPSNLVLAEVGPDGRSPGREVTRGRPTSFDDNGMAVYTFDPIAHSAGHRYLFILSCPECNVGQIPGMLSVEAERAPANMVVAGRLVAKRVGSFSPLYGQLAAVPAATTAIRSVRPGPGRWALGVLAPRPALVVVAEAWFPGWSATVDGKDASVMQADGGFLGVPVAAGSHQIRLEFKRPAIAGVGRAVTALTLAASVVLIVIPRRRRKARRVPG